MTRRLLGMFGVLAVIATVPTMAGCAGGFGMGAGNGGCSIRADYVHASRGTPGQMVGKATITCSVTVTDARLDLRLERLRGGSWVVIADNSRMAGKYNPYIGTLFADNEVPRQVFIACAGGTYRIGARGSARLNGAQSASAAWEYGTPRTDPCAKGA